MRAKSGAPSDCDRRRCRNQLNGYVCTGGDESFISSFKARLPLHGQVGQSLPLLRPRRSSVRPFALRSLRKALPYSRFPGDVAAAEAVGEAVDIRIPATPVFRPSDSDLRLLTDMIHGADSVAIFVGDG